MTKNCIQTCCCPASAKEKKPLTLGASCVVPPGIYKNVNVEINEHCRIVSLTPANAEEVYLCDPCPNDTNNAVTDSADSSDDIILTDETITVTACEQSSQSIFNNDRVPFYASPDVSPVAGFSVDKSGFVRVDCDVASGTYQIPYSVDYNGVHKTAVATVVVKEKPKRPLKAVDDVFDVVEGGTTDSVLLNDTMPNGRTPDSSLVEVKGDGKGLTIDKDGFIHVSDDVPAGSHQLTYTITDRQTGETATAIATINVSEKPKVLTATDDTFVLTAVDKETKSEKSILDNDFLADGTTANKDNVKLMITKQAGKEITVDDDGYIHYTENTPAGKYTIRYNITDMDTEEFDEAEVKIEIKPKPKQ